MLTLPIKKKWFDMILSGEKTEEYRNITPYYNTRFRNVWGPPEWWYEPHKIKFRNGYRAFSPFIEAECTLATGTGKTKWGAEPGKKCFILHIVKITGRGFTEET